MLNTTQNKTAWLGWQDAEDYLRSTYGRDDRKIRPARYFDTKNTGALQKRTRVSTATATSWVIFQFKAPSRSHGVAPQHMAGKLMLLSISIDRPESIGQRISWIAETKRAKGHFGSHGHRGTCSASTSFGLWLYAVPICAACSTSASTCQSPLMLLWSASSCSPSVHQTWYQTVHCKTRGKSH